MLGSAGGESVHSVAMLERSIPISNVGTFAEEVSVRCTGGGPNDIANTHPNERTADKNFFMGCSIPSDHRISAGARPTCLVGSERRIARWPAPCRHIRQRHPRRNR